MSGSTSTVHNTSQIATLIGAAGLVLSLLIFSVALAIVIVHDGNTTEVTTAMNIVGTIAQGLAVGAVVLAGAAGAVSAFVSRFTNGILPNDKQPTPPQG